MPSPSRRAVRGRLLHFAGDPAESGPDKAAIFTPDGVVVMEDGLIVAAGPAAEILRGQPTDLPVDHHPDCLVLPGLIDLHIHFPQTQVIASDAAELLEWLNRYTFVEEQRFEDAGHATRIARFFFDELLRNGTTTAAVYCTVRPESVDAFFAESERRGTRMIAGKVMMDRGAPPRLLDTPERGYAESRALAERWHGRGRHHYCVTPRFALTSSEPQLEAAAALWRELPEAFLQTHLCETVREIEAVRGLFPDARSYTDVYDRYGLLGPRAILGHCIHFEDEEVARLAESGAAAAFCPTSNLFLGSGLFDRDRLRAAGVRTGLGTDVGGGTSYSMLRTAAEAYKVVQMRRQRMTVWDAFFWMTLGNAQALGLADRIGTLDVGSDADLVVLDPRATPSMAHRMETVAELGEELFALMTLGDDRAVRAVYVAGSPALPGS